MRIAKTYPTITKRIYHPEITHCPTCGTRLPHRRPSLPQHGCR